jgi:hypothetical protein
MSIHALTMAPLRRIARELAVIAIATVVAVGTANAQQRPRSQADSSDPDARGTTRQTVTPGGEGSSRTTVAPRGEASSRNTVTPGGEESSRTTVAPGGEGSSRRPPPEGSDDGANSRVQGGAQPAPGAVAR